MNRFLLCFLVSMAALIHHPVQASSLRIDVFTDEPLVSPLEPNIHVWDLSKPQKVKAQFLPKALPGEPGAAKKIMSDFIQSPEGHQFTQAMKDAYQGFAEMARLRVQKVPAIVINQRYVIYGITDIDVAMSEYAAFMGIRR